MNIESLGITEQERSLLADFFRSTPKRDAMSNLLERRIRDHSNKLRTEVTMGKANDAAVTAGQLREIDEIIALFTDIASS